MSPSESKCGKLLTKAKTSRQNFKFDDLCKLAECFGWEFARQSGSHRIFDNPDIDQIEYRIMNFQDKKGNAKPGQIKQLLEAIDFLDRLPNDE